MRPNVSLPLVTRWLRRREALAALSSFPFIAAHSGEDPAGGAKPVPAPDVHPPCDQAPSVPIPKPLLRLKVHVIVDAAKGHTFFTPRENISSSGTGRSTATG